MVDFIVKKTKIVQLIGFLIAGIAAIGILQTLRIMDSSSSVDFVKLVFLIFWVLIGIAGYGLVTLSISSLKRSAMMIVVTIVLNLFFAGFTLFNNLYKYKLMVSASANGAFESHKFEIVYLDFIIYLFTAALLLFIYLICMKRSKLVEMQNR